MSTDALQYDQYVVANEFPNGPGPAAAQVDQDLNSIVSSEHAVGKLIGVKFSG